MLREHVARQRGGRQCVLSIINAEAARRYGSRVRPNLLAYVMGHKPRGSSGFLPERGAQGRAWTRVSTGPLLKSGSSPSRDLAKARSLLGGTWGLPEGPGMPSWEPRTCMHMGPVSYCGGPDPMMHPGVYYLPCAHVGAITAGLPMVMPTATPIPTVDWPVIFILNANAGPCAGCLESLHWF
jgi:hypothetical protein